MPIVNLMSSNTFSATLYSQQQNSFLQPKPKFVETHDSYTNSSIQKLTFGNLGKTLLTGALLTLATAMYGQINPNNIKSKYPMMTKMALWDHRNKPSAEDGCSHFNPYPELKEDPRAAYYYYETRKKIGADPFKTNGKLPDELTFDQIKGVMNKNGLKIDGDGYVVKQ